MNRPDWIAWPSHWAPRFNGGVRCDALKGPCACGATHEGETPIDVGPHDEIYEEAIRKLEEL